MCARVAVSLPLHRLKAACRSRWLHGCFRRPNTRLSAAQRDRGPASLVSAAMAADFLATEDFDSASGSNRRRRRRTQPTRGGRAAKTSKVCRRQRWRVFTPGCQLISLCLVTTLACSQLAARANDQSLWALLQRRGRASRHSVVSMLTYWLHMAGRKARCPRHTYT